MRTLNLVVLALFGLAACSRARPHDGEKLDLMLPDYTGATRVASALEIWGKDKPTAAAPAASGPSAARHVPRRMPARHHRPRLVRAPIRARVRAPLGTVARVAIPAPAPAPVPAPAAAPAPDPRPGPTAEPQQGHGLGGLGGILRGIGGVIIIRGGYGGTDPCDERGHGMGRGMPMPLPAPGRSGRFPGGIVF